MSAHLMIMVSEQIVGTTIPHRECIAGGIEKLDQYWLSDVIIVNSDRSGDCLWINKFSDLEQK